MSTISKVLCPVCAELVPMTTYCQCGKDLRHVIAKAACEGLITFADGLTAEDRQLLTMLHITTD